MYDFDPILRRIKDAKSNCGYTNEALSIASGVPIGTINKILSGDTKEPKLPALIAISEALRVSADYLIYGERQLSDIPPAFPSDEQKLLGLYRGLTTQGKEYVLQSLDLAARVYIKSNNISIMEEMAE